MTIDEMLEACDAITDARQLLNKTKVKMVPKSPDLKVYLALISWDGPVPPRIPSKTNPPNIEMTILAITKQSAEDKVREILGDDGYAVDDVNFLLHLREIEGPFKAGFVISRNGG